MNYIENEQAAYAWFKENYDNEATLYGGYDAIISDIYSPKYEGFIEVKMISRVKGARCGQFTVGTIDNNPYSRLIYNGDYSPNTLINFIKSHYATKQVKGFIVGESENEYKLLTFDEFVLNTVLSVQTYGKRSGTASCPQKYQELILKEYPSFQPKDKKIYCSDSGLWGTYFLSQGQEFFISPKCDGEVRKCSNTKNITYHIEVKLK